MDQRVDRHRSPLGGPVSTAKSPQVPQDPEAEEALVGAILSSTDAAILASGRIGPEELYNETLRRIWEVVAQLDAVRLERERVRLVASALDIREESLWHLVEDTPTLRDGDGRYASRIRTAARRRRLMAFAAHLYNGAADESPEQLLAWTQEADLEASKLVHEAELRVAESPDSELAS